MKKSLKIIFIICLSNMILNCSNFQKSLYREDYTYLNSRDIPPLHMPRGLAEEEIDNYYEVPAGPTTHHPVSLTPPGSELTEKKNVNNSENKDSHRTSTAQNQSNPKLAENFLVLQKPIDDAWQAVQDALVKTNYKIIKSEREVRTFYIAPTNAEKEIYLIHLLPQDETTRISITDNQGNSVQDHLTKRLLVKLQHAIDTNPSVVKQV